MITTTALPARTHITATSQRPTDSDFQYFVRFYEPRRGVRVLWTDSRECAETFAASHRCYARPATVQTRARWAEERSIGLSFGQEVVK